jgi:hypothetical protein
MDSRGDSRQIFAGLSFLNFNLVLISQMDTEFSALWL